MNYPPCDSTLKIGLVQMLCEKADIKGNLQSHLACIDEADKKGVDIIAFPEASITGYIDPTKYPQAIISTDGPEVHAVLRLTKRCKTTVLAGLIEKNPTGKPFVTQVVARDGKMTGLYRKKIIGDEPPEADRFSPGKETAVFKHKSLKYGIAICADIGGEDIFAEYARQGARIVFECAAPGLHGEQATRDWSSGFDWWEGECLKYLPAYAQKYGIWIAVTTQAGRTVDEDFPGGNYIFAPDGERVYATKDWQPGAVYLALDLITYRVTEL